MSQLILPDILLLLFPFALILLRQFFPNRRELPFRASVVFFATHFVLLNALLVGDTQTYLSNWRIDSFGILMREVLVLGTLLSLFFAKDYFDHPADGKPELRPFPYSQSALPSRGP